MTVEKRGKHWCVIHAHAQKTGSKTDKSKGSVIKCYSIEKLGETEAKNRAEKMHKAILMSQMKAKQGDSIVLRNQPIAREGVLEYPNARKAKLWDHLKLNIGRVVPILDEHPPEDNNYDGMFSGKEHVYGWAEITGNEKIKELAADMILDDDAPFKNAYSIGYPYIVIDEPGSIDGKDYDEVQGFLIIDHVALTDYPRDETAIALAGDSKKSEIALAIACDSIKGLDGTPSILKYCFGYDSIIFNETRKNEIRDLILKDNPDIDESKLLALVERAYNNEQNHPRTKVKKNMTPDPTEEKTSITVATDAKVLEENAKLREELAKLKATMGADSEKAKLQSDLDAARKIADAMTKERDALLNAQTSAMVAFLSEHGFDSKSFDGKSREYIQGAYDAIKDASLGIDTGETVDTDASEDEEQPMKKIQTSEYSWDADAKRMYRIVNGKKVYAGDTDLSPRAQTGKQKTAPSKKKGTGES